MPALPHDVEELLNDLAAKLPLKRCPAGGSEIVPVNCAFFSPDPNGKTMDASFVGLPRLRRGRRRVFRTVGRPTPYSRVA
jgi:hypothetical protein